MMINKKLVIARFNELQATKKDDVLNNFNIRNYKEGNVALEVLSTPIMMVEVDKSIFKSVVSEVETFNPKTSKYTWAKMLEIIDEAKYLCALKEISEYDLAGFGHVYKCLEEKRAIADKRNEVNKDSLIVKIENKLHWLDDNSVLGYSTEAYKCIHNLVPCEYSFTSLVKVKDIKVILKTLAEKELKEIHKILDGMIKIEKAKY